MIGFLTVFAPCISEDQPRLRNLRQSAHGTVIGVITHQSVACQVRSKDAAKTASELALEKEAMASWSPFRAIPPW